jgi:ABC-type dipeptide/oligopeptide/nickel transport system permease subunit
MQTTLDSPTARHVAAESPAGSPAAVWAGWRANRVLRRFLRDRYSLAALAVLGLIVLASVLAPVLTPYDPTITSPRERMQLPSLVHPLGTDSLGRDMLSRVLYGGRISLAIGFSAVAIGLLGGVLLGALAGYFRRLDNPIMRVVDVMLAFPSVLLALAIVATLGPGIEKAVLAVGMVNVPLLTRLTRSQVLSMRERDFALAARSLGARDGRILFRHILPNCLGVILVYSTVRLGHAITMAATLSFLGLGAQPPSPEWGAMAASGRQYLSSFPLIATWPSLAIFLTFMAANLVGDGLRDALDPRTERSMLQ